uniref:NB-ARC domain-containing protein n=1 Tax=Corethron hystrix TaxID=216773 RepID=A0A7S1B481_9STRA|mmetsp:Transcript_11815/g.25893  ORF Transcript_11815/g.25893 Transcript_11815/m.25893 type:complete len:971 (+) Transcript_11815:96-3008(+)
MKPRYYLIIKKTPTIMALAKIPVEASSILSSSQNDDSEPILIPRARLLLQICDFLQGGKNSIDLDNKYVEQSQPPNYQLTLRGMGGIGKSTLAAMAVSSTNMRSYFDHILWLNLGQNLAIRSGRNNLTYDIYLQCLRQICDQLQISAEIFHVEVVLQPGDNALTKAAKTVQAMEKSKIDMANIIKGLKVLVILDDVWNHEDVDLFNFGEHMSSPFSLLLTTRTFDKQPNARSHFIDIDLLNQEEASRLFCLEASLVGSIEFNAIQAIDSLMKKCQCGNLPFAIRMLARRLKAFQRNSSDISLTDLVKTMEDSTQNPNLAPMINLLDKSFAFVADGTMQFATKLFFSIFTRVFYREDCLKAWVPEDVVNLLWKSIYENDDTKELKYTFSEYKIKRIGDISELMCAIGLLDESNINLQGQQTKRQKQFRVHHDLMWEYGKWFSSKVDSVNEALNRHNENSFHEDDKRLAGIREQTLKRNTVKWNKMIVEWYFSRPFENIVFFSDWLPIHMVNAEMFDEASALLRSEEMFVKQLMHNGVRHGTLSIVAFIRLFKSASASYSGTTAMSNRDVISPITLVISSLHCFLFNFCITSTQLDISSKREIGHALILLGVEIQKNWKWADALDYFCNALIIFRSTGCPEDHLDILRVNEHIESCALNHIILVPFGSPHRLQLKYAESFCMEGADKTNLSLELSSHPGYAIVKMEDYYIDPHVWDNISWTAVPLGVGPKDSSLLINYDGNKLKCTTDESSFFVGMATLNVGMPTVMRTRLEFQDDRTRQKSQTLIKKFDSASLFSISPDGSIYPVMAPHLCLGISPYPCLLFVYRKSPNRAIFKHISDLINYQPETSSSEILLELSSHPGMGIVSHFDAAVTTLSGHTIIGVGLGPLEKTLSVRTNKKKEIETTGNFNKMFLGYLAEDRRLMLSSMGLWPPFKHEFVFNPDGTISPKEDTNYVFGFQVPGTELFRNAQENT